VALGEVKSEEFREMVDGEDGRGIGSFLGYLSMLAGAGENWVDRNDSNCCVSVV